MSGGFFFSTLENDEHPKEESRNDAVNTEGDEVVLSDVIKKEFDAEDGDDE